MSIFGRLLRSTPFDNPQVPLTSANVAYFLDLFGGGRTDSNEIVTPLTSLQLATAFGCVRLLSDQVGICPQGVWEKVPKGKVLARKHPLFSVLATRPNPEMSAKRIKQAMVAQMLLWGNGYVEIQRDGGGRPIALWPRGAWKTKPVRINGELKFETTDNERSELRYIDPENMIHVPYVSLDGQLGLSPVAMVRQTFGTALAMDRFSARFFGNYAKPQLALRYPGMMKPEDKTKARNDWEALQSGSNQHRVAILDGGSDVKELTMPLEDAQFLQSRQFSDTRICAIYGVPPHMMGIIEKAVKANVEQQSIEMLQYTMQPILDAIDQEFNAKLLPDLGRAAGKYFIGFDTRQQRLPDNAARQAYYQSGIQNGYLTQDEVREFEGLNSYEGDLGSQPAIQLNMQPLAALSKLRKPSVDIDEESELNGLLSKLSGIYSPIFRDGLSRFMHRQKRDFAGMHACLGPCIEAISILFRGQIADAPESGSTLRLLLEGWLQRSNEWDLEQLDQVATRELRVAIPALADAARMDAKAAIAAQRKEEENDVDD